MMSRRFSIESAILPGLVVIIAAFLFGVLLTRSSAQAQQPMPLPPAGGTPVVTRDVDTAQLTPVQPSTDVRTLQDVSVFDLRGWHRPPAGATGRDGSPAGYVNVLRMRKLRDVQQDVSHYATSGTVIDLSCLTLTCAAERARFREHDASWTEYALKADISHVRRGDEFLLVVNGTYWDGFRNDTLESADTYLDYDGDPDTQLSLVVLFSPKKPGRIVRLDRVDDKTSATFPIPFLGVVAADTPRTVFRWDVAHPVRGSHYVATWRW